MRYISIICIVLFSSIAYAEENVLERKNNLELHIDSIKTHGGFIMPVIDDISYTRTITDKHTVELRRHLFEVEKLHLGPTNYESNIGTHFLIYRYTVWSNESNRISVGPALLTRRISMRGIDLDKTYHHDTQPALSASWYSDLPRNFFLTVDISLNYFGHNRNFFDSEFTCSRLVLDSPFYVGMGFHFQVHKRDLMHDVVTLKSSSLILVVGLIF